MGRISPTSLLRPMERLTCYPPCLLHQAPAAVSVHIPGARLAVIDRFHPCTWLAETTNSQPSTPIGGMAITLLQ